MRPSATPYPPLPGAVFRTKLALLLLLLAVAIPSWHPRAVQAAGADMQDCEINKGACTKKSGNALVTLDIHPKPVKVMQDLSFTVTVKGGRDYDHLLLDLQMVGMNMGPNQVTLVKSAAGTYTGKGIIPKCHSGMKLWSASVALPGNPAQTEFLFNVLY